MNKELLESYMKAIEEELGMMKVKNITGQVLSYIDSPMCTYKKLEKAIKHEEKEYTKDEHKDIEGTDVDNRIEDSLDEHETYIHYKKEYAKSGKQSDLDMSREKLQHFLQAIVDVFSEMEESSRNNMEERALIKSRIKECYQVFS